MTPTRATRKRSASKTFGEKPFTGRRFVSNGKVRIEWMEAGRRRSRTIGPDSPETRAEADAEVRRLLAEQQADVAPGASESTRDERDEFPSALEALRLLALAMLNVADDLVERVRDALATTEDE
jgi:hypothetical protein